MNVLSYFTDAVLRGPTIGCMLMCLAAGLVGVIVFLRKQSLLGESLSHAAYPGVVLGAIIAAALQETSDLYLSAFILVGAFFAALAGLWAIHYLQLLKIRTDSALCFVLSCFFGLGITLASHLQFSHPAAYRQIQGYLYGQAATMTDIHILIFGALSLLILCCLLLFYKELQIITFNRDYARGLGLPVHKMDVLVYILIVLSVVIGIRSVGVVLMSAMLIAPAAAARQYTNQLSTLLFLAAFFGLVSAFLGNYLSVELTHQFAIQYPRAHITLPTGPTIVLVASFICLISIFFSPERGLALRLWRIARFRHQCMRENLLKAIWREGVDEEITFEQIGQIQKISKFYLHFILVGLVNNGWLEKTGPYTYRLTADGAQWAAKIVRLHRLWEVYLADYLGIGAERVHHNAEEMEHILTPELENELTLLLNDPQLDPHQQRIPGKATL